MAHEKIRVLTPNGPLDLLVRDTGDIGVRDCAPDASEFVVNRVALNVYLEFAPSEGGYRWGGYPKGGHFTKRHWVNANDMNPSAKTHDKALSIVEAAIIEHKAEIVALMPKVRVNEAGNALERTRKQVEKARAALEEAIADEREATRAFNDAILALNPLWGKAPEWDGKNPLMNPNLKFD